MKKRSDRAQVHLFAVGMCQNHVVSDNCCRTPFCAETALVRHRFASNYFSLVAGLLPFLWRHIRTVFIEDFLFIRNYVATLSSQFLLPSRQTNVEVCVCIPSNNHLLSLEYVNRCHAQIYLVASYLPYRVHLNMYISCLNHRYSIYVLWAILRYVTAIWYEWG